jgi:hypothetical protein
MLIAKTAFDRAGSRSSKSGCACDARQIAPGLLKMATKPSLTGLSAVAWLGRHGISRQRACGSTSTWSTATGPLVFAHACKMGLESIVLKRKDSPYGSGRSPHWIKSKNPTAPAMKREAEENWGR